MSLLVILFAGFLLGLRHATDADHLAAMATLATGRSTLAQAMRQGIAWGMGHTVTLMMFGGIVLALGKAIPPTVAQAPELAVALMLIALGADVLHQLARQKIHFRAHRHAAQTPHVHAHTHVGSTSMTRLEHKRNHTIMPTACRCARWPSA